MADIMFMAGLAAASAGAWMLGGWPAVVVVGGAVVMLIGLIRGGRYGTGR